MTRRPEPIARIAALMSTFEPWWCLCGGWAVDSWLGRETREHGDLDITVFHDDQQAIFHHLESWQLVGHDPNVAGATTERWNGRRLDLPAHIHALPENASRKIEDWIEGTPPASGPEQRSTNDFELEILLNERSGSDWILSREPRLALPLDRCARQSGWALPTLAPELILFYKATAYFDVPEFKDRWYRPRDVLDFRALLAMLADSQRDWLWQTIALVHPRHSWLTGLPD